MFEAIIIIVVFLISFKIGFGAGERESFARYIEGVDDGIDDASTKN
jgi:hypothetical protein